MAIVASIAVVVAGARGSNGSALIALALLLPLVFLTSVFVLMMMTNVFTADCGLYHLEFW